MKKNIRYQWLLFLLAGLFTISGCTKEDKCETVDCQNGGTCLDGNCGCPKGYLGSRCETMDKPYFLCGNSSKRWKFSSIEEDGVKIALDDEDKLFRMELRSDGKAISIWGEDTTVGAWSYNQATDKLTMEEDIMDSFTLSETYFSVTRNQSKSWRGGDKVVKQVITFEKE